MSHKDFYKTLGVSKTAGADELKKAYRKLAALHHPDKHGGTEEATRKFAEISEAYEVLKDPEKRKYYDKFGEQWKQYQQADVDPDNPFAGAGAGAGGFGANGFRQQGGNPFGQSGGADFGDFFESIFGGGGSPFGAGGPHSQSRQRQRSRPAKGADIQAEVKITIEEAISGTSRDLRIGTEKVTVKIPAGTKAGTKLKLKGKGQPGPDGFTRGDLILKVAHHPHPTLSLEGDKLYLNQPVSVAQMLLGGSITVQTPEKQLRLNLTESTPNGKVFRIPNMGFPEFRKPENKGPLYVRMQAEIPQYLTPEQKELIRQAFPS
ncbi:curved DNA-binding protein [Cyclonatronum proteinivorum]|uniref:Curved DNA-binding protein n=1 Tax=Cyclonatronum proteinivorum TaxID=1457365 RepID=A0A345UJZ8_9BACT|nr:J domain-containing protein [Cyclonatronum proteinivorum]AXJ00800.1 curved DNA-binding protein [Cyclonatronum proteinivorum]